MGKKITILTVGTIAAAFVTPMVVGMLGIQQSPGFGLDDVVAAVVTAAVILAVMQVAG